MFVGPADRLRVEDDLRTRGDVAFDSTTWIPDDDLVLATEPSVGPLFDIPGEPFLMVVRQLMDRLTDSAARVVA